MKPYTYNATVTRVVDGDTVDVDIDLGFGVIFKNQRIRLMGVDTPECRTRDLVEKRYGILAKQKVEGLCPVGEPVLLETVLDDKGKFGRILGTIMVADGSVNLNEFLIENHFAVRYEGQSKEAIAEAHLANYKMLAEWGQMS